VDVQPQFEGERRVKLESHVVHELEFEQDIQWAIAIEQELHKPEVKYSVLLQLQLVDDMRVKLVAQEEQEVALEQALQLEIAAEQL